MSRLKKTKPAHAPYRPPDARDYVRRALKEAGAWGAIPQERKKDTRIEKLLTAAHISEKLAMGLNEKEQQQLEADLSAIGIVHGQTSGTVPEELTAKWLMNHQYRYGGMGPSYNGGDWGFQVPLMGGRANRDGSVADIFVSPRASGTNMGVAIRVNGLYWHLKPAIAYADQVKKDKLLQAGYRVEDLPDTEVLQPAMLDQRMRSWLPRH